MKKYRNQCLVNLIIAILFVGAGSIGRHIFILEKVERTAEVQEIDDMRDMKSGLSTYAFYERIEIIERKNRINFYLFCLWGLISLGCIFGFLASFFLFLYLRCKLCSEKTPC